jgi:hypothetical protein
MSIFDRFRRKRPNQLSCEEVGRVLQQFLDEELTSEMEPLVQAHLDECLRCGLEASVYRDLKASLARQGEPPEESVQRLRDFGERLARGEVTGLEPDGSR